MKLVDANILPYAVNSSSGKHTVARRWLDRDLARFGVPMLRLT